jgi:hypothetical protein
MTIRPAGITGAACAVMTLFFLTSAAWAAPKSAPLSSSPSAQSAPQAKAAPVRATRVAAKGQRVATKGQRASKRPNRVPAWDTFTMGQADLAFLSAGQYLDLSTNEGVILVMAESEFSLLDFAAGNVRLVDPGDLTEVDLANDPDVLLARNTPLEQVWPDQQTSVVSAPPPADDTTDDDSVLNRILMTFAGALAMASAMRMIIG